MKNNLLKSGLLLMVWMMHTLPVWAAQGPLEDPPEGEDPLEDPVPIDHWMLILLLAGMVLGTYLVLRYNRKSIANS